MPIIEDPGQVEPKKKKKQEPAPSYGGFKAAANQANEKQQRVAAPAPIKPVLGAPPQPAPDPATIVDQQTEAINGYIYQRAQRYIVGSAFTDTFGESQNAKLPDYDATTHGGALFWTQHPETFGNTIGANVTEEQHKKLVKHIPGVYDWIAQHDKVGDMPGVMTGLRLAALHIINPEVRTWALNYIDSIKNLSAGDQAAVVAFMQEQTGQTTPEAMLRQALHTRRAYINAAISQEQSQFRASGGYRGNKEIATAERAGGQGGVTPEQTIASANEEYAKAQAAGDQAGMDFWRQAAENALTPAVQGNLGEHGPEYTVAGEDKAKAAEHWFNTSGFNLPVTIHWNTADIAGVGLRLAERGIGAGQAVDSGLLDEGNQFVTNELMGTTDDEHTLHRISTKSAVIAGAVVATAIIAPEMLGYLGTQAFTLAKVQTFMRIMHQLNLATAQAAKMSQDVNSAGITGGGILGGVTQVGGDVLGGLATGLHAGVGAVDSVMVKATDTLATGTAAAAHAAGIDMTATQASIAAQIELAMVMEGMGRAGAAVKLNLGMTADAAAGELGVGETLGSTYQMHDSSMFHPWKTVMDPLIDHGVTQFMQAIHATDLPSTFERWNNSNFMGRRGLFDIVEDMRKESNGSREATIGKIRERYPMLPEGYAEALASARREEMLAVSMEYIADWGVRDFKSTKGKIGSVKATIAKLNAIQAPAELAGTQVVHRGSTTYGDDMAEPIIPPGEHLPIREDDLFNEAKDAGMSSAEAMAEMEDSVRAWIDEGWIEHDSRYGMHLYPPGTKFPGEYSYDKMNGPYPIVGRQLENMSNEDIEAKLAEGWVTNEEIAGPEGWDALYPPGTEYTPYPPDQYVPHPMEGQPKVVYSGHGTAFENFEEGKLNPRALYGKGVYTTEDYTLAGGPTDEFNIRQAQKSGGKVDPDKGQPELNYAGKTTQPSYESHTYNHEEVSDGDKIRGPVRLANEAAKMAIMDRETALIQMGLDPANYEISLTTTPHYNPNNNTWSVLTKAIDKAAGEEAPTVHFGYMDIKHPFDINRHYTSEEATDILNRVGEAAIGEPPGHTYGPMDGQQLYDYVQDMADRYGKGIENTNALLEQAGFDGITHIGGHIMGGGHEHRVWIAFHPEQFHRGFTGAEMDKLAMAQAEKAALEDKLTTLQSTENEVITHLPTHNMPDFLHRVMYRPVGPAEATFRAILNPGRYAKQFGRWAAGSITGGEMDAQFFNKNSQSWAAKLVDKLDRRPELRYVSPTAPRAERMLIHDNSLQILDRTFQKLGVSAEDGALFKGKLLSAKTQPEWFDVVSQDLLGSEGPGMHLMNKYLPSDTPQFLRDRILGMANPAEAPAYYQRNIKGGGPNGETALANMLNGEVRRGVPQPLPAAPSMFKNQYSLPIGDIEEALGTVSRWRANVGNVSFSHGKLFQNTAAQVFDWGKAAMSLATSAGKPLVMLANIPAIIATKMLDETMGNTMDPRIMRTFKTRADAMDYMTKVDPRIMGKVVAGSSWLGFDGMDLTSSDVEHTAAALYQRGMTQDIAESMGERLVDMSTDPMISRVALENDSEKMWAILNGEEHAPVDYTGATHIYHGEAPPASKSGARDGTRYWWKGYHGADTSAQAAEAALETARSYATTAGDIHHYVIAPEARVLTQGTPEFDALVGPDSEFHSQASDEYVPGSILPGYGKSQADELDRLYLAARDAGYDAIHMTEQDALGTAVINPGVLRDPYRTTQPVMADDRLERFFREQLRPQVERSLEAAGIEVTDEAVKARTVQLMSDWTQTIHEASMQHPDLLDFVKHGRVGGRGMDMHQVAKLGEEGQLRYQRLQQEAANLRVHLATLDPVANEAATAAAQQHLHDKLEQIDYIENEVLGAGDQTDQLLGAGSQADQIRQDTKKDLAKHINNLFDANELTVPDKFTVRETMARTRSASTTDAARSNASRLQGFMYRHGFQFIGKAETATAKGSFFLQRGDAIAKGYIRAGMRADEATALAEWKALDETRDMYYDISTKSTAERSVRNLMWFAPVQGELMYRWLYKIPAEHGAWLPGAALMTARLDNWYHLLKSTGLVQKDEYTGQDVIMVPGLGMIMNHLTKAAGAGESKYPDNLAVPLLSINPHLFGVVKDPLPQLSPVPSWAIETAAGLTHSKTLLDLGTMFGQGGTNQFVPSAINSLLGMYGINVGDHMMGTSYQRLQWDRAHDVGLQYAWHDMQKSGNLPPSLATYGLDSASKNYIEPNAQNSAKIDQAKMQYQVAWAGWFHEFNQLGDQYARGAYALNALSSSVLPGYIQESDSDQRAYQQFFKDNILPKITAGEDQGVISNSVNKWLAQHPASQAFSISYNYYTGQQWDTPYELTDKDYAKQLFNQGVKAPMDPKDYQYFLSGKAMVETYRSQLNGAIKQAAPDGQWQTLLRNWYKRGVATQQYAQELDMFDRLNPNVLRVYNDVASRAAQVGHVYPHQGLVYEYVSEAMNSLKLVAPILLGGESKQDFKTVMSRLGQARAQLYRDTGGKSTPLDKGLNWYFDNVVGPYYDTVNPLYEKAKKLTAEGADKARISDIYHQIDVARRKFDNPGKGAPSPSEFAYSSLSPFDQKLAVTSWATQPPSWLSEFQREKVYGEPDPQLNKMYDFLYHFNKTEVLPALDGASPGSKLYDAITAWRDEQYRSIAEQYQHKGMKNAVHFMELENSAPYLRLQEMGWQANNAFTKTIFGAADQATSGMEAAGVSPRGFSKDAVTWKTWFYQNLNRFLASDKPGAQKMQQAFDILSQSQKTVGTTGIHPTGLPLYEAIFFNNFSVDKYPPPKELTDLFK